MLVAGLEGRRDQAASVDGVNQVILSNEGKNDLCTLIYRANTLAQLAVFLIAPLSNGLAETVNAVVLSSRVEVTYFSPTAPVSINAPIVSTSHRVWPPAHRPTYNSLYPRGGPSSNLAKATCRVSARNSTPPSSPMSWR